MKSCLSLLMMLIVVAAVLAGGYWLYKKSGGHELSATSEGTTLTLENQTSFGLTVELRGPLLVQFAIMPGKKQTRSVAPGTYQVKGRISDAKTEAFSGSWTFERDHDYHAGFTRADQGGSGAVVGGLIRMSDAHP